MVCFFQAFLKNDRGATAIEYGLIAALISVVVVAAVPLLGPPLIAAFEGVRDHLNTAAGR